jgi:hypothetical protein
MDAEKKQVLLSVILNVETLSYVRNQDEKQLAIDITENEDFNNQAFTLHPNVPSGINPKSQKTIEEIESFLYIYSPYSIEGTFTKLDGTSFTITLIDLTILREAFTSVTLKNLDTTASATIKAIYS